MSEVAFPIVWAIGLLVFAVILAGRARLLLAARPAARLDRFPARVRRAVVDGMGQRKFLSGEQPAGIMHALIFWGFVVLMIQVVLLFGRTFDAGWDIPGFAADQPLGPPFFIARDVLELVVIVGVAYMLYRRLVAHTPRLSGMRRAEQRYRDAPHWEGVLILCFILFIMVGGLLYDAGRLVAEDIHGTERDFAPLAAPVAAALGGLSRSTAQTVSEAGWWLHCVTILVFLSLLPLTKHFHIITAIPNVFFAKLPPRAAERPLAITQVPAAPVAALDPPPEGLVGVASLADVSWKQVLDAFSCTECGRCTAVCPATASRRAAGAPAADPRHPGPPVPRRRRAARRRLRAADLRRGAVVVHDLHGVRRGVPGRDRARADHRRHAPEPGRPGRARSAPPADAAELRRERQLLRQVRRACAPAGPSASTSRSRTRARSPCSTSGSSATSPPSTSACSAPRRRVARILHDAGVSFGLLYEGERNAGNDVRRIGEEGLFELLVEQNMAALGKAQFEAIFTTDPHSLNTLRNEYPQYGLEQPVYHYTELFADLVSRGVLSLRTPLSGTRVTYHDPCYLARYNRITEAPRQLIEATGAELVEMPRHGTETFCCGAGGGRIWMSDDAAHDERPSEQRIREAQTLGELDYFLVTCPKDLAMYSDAVKVVGADFEVAELTALIERALVEAEAEPVAGA